MLMPKPKHIFMQKNSQIFFYRIYLYFVISLISLQACSLLTNSTVHVFFLTMTFR